MDTRKLLTFTLILTFALPFAASAEYQLPPPEGDSFIYFSADNLNYDSEARTVNLEGDVELTVSQPDTSETHIFTQNLTVNQGAQTVSSRGEVRVEQGDNVLTGRDIDFNYSTNDLSINNISANYPPLRLLHADEARMEGGKKIFKGAKVTCCDVEDPHYYIKAGHVSLNEKQRVFAYNGLLYAGDVPVFYLPVFWRSLDSQKPFTTYVDFTQSAKTGFGLQTSTVFYPSKYLRSIINLDGYTKAGFGYGAQMLVRNTDRVKGNVEAYAIDDNEYDKSRWGVTGGLRALLLDTSNELNREDGGAMYQNQSQFRAVSDPYFNDTYFRSNPYRFMPDQDINFAFSRQSRSSIMRLSYSQRDEFDADKEKYRVVERNLPKFEYNLMPFTAPLGIVNTFSATIYNTQLNDEDYNQTANAVWRAQRSFKINRTFTFTPYVLADERITFNDSNYDDDNSYITRLGGGANLRANLITGSLDISYAYTKRFKTNSLKSDDVSNDKGEEESLLYIQNYFNPISNTYLRLGTGYDLRNDGQDWGLDARMEPLLAEAGVYTSNGNINFFVQNLYDFYDGQQSFIMQTDFKILHNSRFAVGMTNHANDINSYLINTKLWLRPKNWTVYFDAGMDFEIKQGSLTAYSKSVRMYKDFHDMHLQFAVEDRNENLSFAFRFNVLCGAKGRVDTYSNEDRYWSPWRKPGDLRD